MKVINWKPCRKRPVVVHVREVLPDETGVETLEGFKTCNPSEHYIMMGVHGEVYPIAKVIFHETYALLTGELDGNSDQT